MRILLNLIDWILTFLVAGDIVEASERRRPIRLIATPPSIAILCWNCSLHWNFQRKGSRRSSALSLSIKWLFRPNWPFHHMFDHGHIEIMGTGRMGAIKSRTYPTDLTVSIRGLFWAYIVWGLPHRDSHSRMRINVGAVFISCLIFST